MSGNLEYIDDLGMGSQSTEETAPPAESTPDEKVETEQPNIESLMAELESLKSQTEGMQKRIDDKDVYIEQLRKSKNDEPEEETEEDFWSNPEKTIKALQDTMRVQQLQLQEQYYAATVDDYWKVVNPESLRQAVSGDEEFSK